MQRCWLLLLLNQAGPDKGVSGNLIHLTMSCGLCRHICLGMSQAALLTHPDMCQGKQHCT